MGDIHRIPRVCPCALLVRRKRQARRRRRKRPQVRRREPEPPKHDGVQRTPCRHRRHSGGVWGGAASLWSVERSNPFTRPTKAQHSAVTPGGAVGSDRRVAASAPLPEGRGELPTPPPHLSGRIGACRISQRECHAGTRF